MIEVSPDLLLHWAFFLLMLQLLLLLSFHGAVGLEVLEEGLPVKAIFSGRPLGFRCIGDEFIELASVIIAPTPVRCAGRANIAVKVGWIIVSSVLPVGFPRLKSLVSTLQSDELAVFLADELVHGSHLIDQLLLFMLTLGLLVAHVQDRSLELLVHGQLLVLEIEIHLV